MTDVMRLLIAAATLVQTAEDFTLRRTMDRERPWALIRDEVPFARLFDILFSHGFVTFTLAARVVAGIALILTPQPIDCVVLILGTWLWAVRWRGNFNGGSDAMTLIVLIGVLIYLINPRYEFAANAYVAAHVITSFFVAGLVKLRNQGWRRGLAPVTFARDVGVTIPPALARVAAWGTIGFELSAPLALTNGSAAVAFTTAALIFHVVNAYVFGLNRFLLAWAAAYPAVIAIAMGLLRVGL